MMLRWKSLLAGAATFVVAHLVEVSRWRAWFDPAGEFRPWFLNTGWALAFTAACLLVAGFAAGLIGAAVRRDAVAHGCSIAAGAVVAMAAVLFMDDPGTLFPIVLTIGALVAAASSLAGTFIGWSSRSVLKSRRSGQE
jgi:hypothetical protein